MLSQNLATVTSNNLLTVIYSSSTSHWMARLINLPIPVCVSSLRTESFATKTSQESREWLMFSTQRHGVLISSPLSPSQNECETNLSREWKNAAVLANKISWRKITITSLTEVTAVSTTNLPPEREKSLLSML